MEDSECKDADSNQPGSTAFAITGYHKARKSRPYRPSNNSKRGQARLDPIYEDANNYVYQITSAVTHGNDTDNDANDVIANGRTNPAFTHDYVEVNELDCGQVVAVSDKRRSNSMFAVRRHSPASIMINDMMNRRNQPRRNSEPVNQAITTEEWASPDTNSNKTNIKRAKSSIYHKGNLYVHNSMSRKDQDRRRWTKLEAEPPQDGYLCCPAERKLERRGFLLLFVLIVICVFLVLGYMIDRWVLIKVGGDETEHEIGNRTMTPRDQSGYPRGT